MDGLGAALHAERQARLASRGGSSRALHLGAFSLSVVELPGAGIGSISWAGGEALARYLLAHPAHVTGRRVLELGCGIGVAGLAARGAGAARVILTDRASLLELARSNVASNLPALGGGVDVTELDWASPAAAPECDVLLGADVVYTSEGAELLAATLNALLAPLGCAQIALIAYKERGAGPAFWAALSRFSLSACNAAPLAVDGKHIIFSISRCLPS
jgi:predicted nicotinamide N-methyase